MKNSLLPVFLLLLPLCACKHSGSTSDANALPKDRPADFLVKLVEHQADGSSNSYSISAKSASFGITDSLRPRVWEFVPSAGSLDSMYQTMLSANLWDIKMVEEGAESSNGSTSDLVINADTKTLVLKDGGPHFIDLEADFNRFRDFNAEVRAFVGKGIADQKHEFRVNVILEKGAPKPDSLEVSLEAAELVKLGDADKVGDTLWGSFTALSGSYLLKGHAVIGGKSMNYTKTIDLQKPTDLTLGVNRQGFVER